jgi:integrase
LDQVPDIEMPKKPEGRIRYLEHAEIEKLLAACADSKNPYLSAIVAIVLNTGLRKEELLGLAWERVDLAADFGLSTKLTLYRTKSGKPRGVPLNQDAVDALATVEPNPERRVGLVFKRRDGRKWGQIRTAFETALTRAEIENFRFHDCRHTFSSHFVMRGGSLYDLKEILGHSDIKMTMRYAHLSPHHLHGSIAKVEGLARIPASTAQKTAQNEPADTHESVAGA